MTKRFVVVAYDIPNDRRRTKLFNALHNFGTPVQFSLFEAMISDAELEQMQAKIRTIIKPRLDHVRIYQLCGACRKLIEATEAGAEPAGEESVWVV
jgi:CRISPR-associated protein Cas2